MCILKYLYVDCRCGAYMMLWQPVVLCIYLFGMISYALWLLINSDFTGRSKFFFHYFVTCAWCMAHCTLHSVRQHSVGCWAIYLSAFIVVACMIFAGNVGVTMLFVVSSKRIMSQLFIV